jgi:hypothetical protein
MSIAFGLDGWPAIRLLVLVALASLAGAAAPAPAGSTGGRRVVFGPDARASGVPSDPAGTFHREPAIAANPARAKNLVAAYMKIFPTKVPIRPCSISTSNDGGLSWTVRGDAPLRSAPGLTGCSDPSLAADDRGTFYLAYLDHNGTPGGGRADYDLRVAWSTDKGKSFGSSVIAVDGTPADFIDKPYVAADANRKSPFRGTVYVTYSNTRPQDGIQVVVSRDGARTWSAPIQLDVRGQGQILMDGSMPVVASDGTVYVFWLRYPYYTPPTSLRFSRSADGGRTWSPAAEAVSGLPTPGHFYLKNANPEFGSVVNRGIPINSFPTAAIASDGTIFVAWTDFPQGSCNRLDSLGPIPPCSNADVRLAASRDGGATWTTPIKVTDETNETDQFFPWLAAHPDGLVSLAWIDRRLDPGNVNYDVFYTNTFDGATFLPNVRVSSTTSVAGGARNIGDYNGITATRAGVFPIWGDLRDPANLQIYIGRGTFPR